MTPEQAWRDCDLQGYVLIRKALQADELKAAQEAFDRIVVEKGKKALAGLLNEEDLFLDLVDHPLIFPLVAAIMGPDVKLRYSRGNIVEPPSKGKHDVGSGWHSDLRNIRGINLPRSIIMMKLFIYLTDVPDDGACLAFVPGSHRFGMNYQLSDLRSPEEMPHHVKVVVEAGDAVLFNGYSLHARFPNRGRWQRRAVETSYIHSWMKSQLDFESLSPRVKNRVMQSHNRRQLFGVPEEGMNDWGRRLEGEAARREDETVRGAMD